MNIRKTTAAVMAGLFIGSALPFMTLNNSRVYAAESTETVQAKPVLSISSAEIAEKDVQKGRSCKVTLSVKGADKLYCSTQIYVYYDGKLKFANDAEAGKAVAGLETTQMKGDSGDFVFLTTAGSENVGLDGDMWSFDFLLPETSKVGDEFEVYVGDSKYGRIPSLFTNFDDDENGQAMTSQAFASKPTAKITVVKNPPYTLGDFNDDGVINAVDASGILSFYAKSSVDPKLKLSDYDFGASDVNKDNVVNGIDASTVLKYYAYVSAKGAISFTDFLKK